MRYMSDCVRKSRVVGPPSRAVTRRGFLASCGRAATGAMLGAMPGIACAAALPPGDTYEGMHDGAAWRHAALARIEQDRKQDFVINVVDSNGMALANVETELRLERHDFGFGGAVKLSRFFDAKYPLEIREEYKRLAMELFHKSVALNAFKWKHIDNNLQYIDEYLSWCAGNSTPVRGHTLVWPRFRRAPDHIRQYADEPDELRAAILAHVKRMVASYRGRIAEWDVLNEPYTEHEYMDILGNDVAGEWYAATRDEDSAAIRYVNDFGVLTRPSKAHQDFYFEYIGGLLESDVPLQGIGFQAHNPAQFPLEAPENILRTLDRFAVYGLDLQVTEFDVERSDRELQARYTMDVLIAIFSHPATVGLLTWTPFEYGSNVVSKPDAAFFDRDLVRRPNGEVWDLLVNNYWRTRESGPTSATGAYRFRGFPGTYSISIKSGASVLATTEVFRRGMEHVTVTLAQGG